jgi:hypothetical protein
MCSLWPTFSVYIHESRTLGKPYGIKVRCYWGLFGEQLGNLDNPVLTPWEHIGNIMGTRKESQLSMQTVHTPLSPYQTQLGKKKPPAPLHSMMQFLIGNSIPKMGCHFFGPGLTALPKNILHISGQGHFFPPPMNVSSTTLQVQSPNPFGCYWKAKLYPK